MSNPQKYHWEVVKSVLRYLKGSVDIRLKYDGFNSVAQVTSFVDSDFVGDFDRMRSLIRYLF